MKGLLIFPILKDVSKADGIVMKNEGIRKGFIANGVEVDTFEFTTKGIFRGGEKIYAFSPGRYRRIYQYWYGMWSRLAPFIEEQGYDFIWFRVPIVNAAIARFVKRLKKSSPSCRIILEYGAYPYVNELANLRKLYYRLNGNSERKAHRYGDFIITYCGQEKVDNLINIPINNGIDLESIPVNPGGENVDGGINFISVSSLKKWHAYERFLYGLADYVRKPDAVPVHFNIVGQGPEQEKLLAVVKEKALEPHVTFHNFKTGKELDAIYRQNHVAIGSLGFHRVNVSTSSSLKNREYFARGLPIVLSTSDLDMPPGLSCVLYVPEGEKPIDLERVVAFAQRAYLQPNLNSDIRSYAEGHVSWKSKIEEVMKYVKGAHGSEGS